MSLDVGSGLWVEDQARKYFRSATERVGQFGFAEQLTYPLIANSYHRAKDIQGAVGEIGVFVGDYLFGLGVCARSDSASPLGAERNTTVGIIRSRRARLPAVARRTRCLGCGDPLLILRD